MFIEGDTQLKGSQLLVISFLCNDSMIHDEAIMLGLNNGYILYYSLLFLPPYAGMLTERPLIWSEVYKFSCFTSSMAAK